jgi:hypothetical protein
MDLARFSVNLAVWSLRQHLTLSYRTKSVIRVILVVGKSVFRQLWQENVLHWFNVETLCSKRKETAFSVAKRRSTLTFLALQRAPYICDISRLRVKEEFVSAIRKTVLLTNFALADIRIFFLPLSELTNSVFVFLNDSLNYVRSLDVR